MRHGDRATVRQAFRRGVDLMGIEWGGTGSQRPSGVGRAMVTGIRRLVTRDAAGAAHRAARRVEFSEHAHALAALRQLHHSAGASFAASLLDKPSGAPAHMSAVHRSELVAGPCRVRRDLRHFF